jgi:hypothetical protein
MRQQRQRAGNLGTTEVKDHVSRKSFQFVFSNSFLRMEILLPPVIVAATQDFRYFYAFYL